MPGLQLAACCLVTEPSPAPEPAQGEILMDQTDGESYVTPREALHRREFYLLWLTR